MRLHGRLSELAEPILTGEVAREVLLPLCPGRILSQIELQKNADFAVELPIAGRTQRYRVNLFVHGPHIGGCIRIIQSEIPDFSWAGFPFELADRLAHLRDGLVLVSGVTGAGKTTTLAMIINLLNQEGSCRIITVEEPIEYVYPQFPTSIITQREVGNDVSSFADGLKYGLRQDPDVILVGDSAANVMAGHETTLPITLDQMSYQASSVIRGVHRGLVVVDLPCGSYHAKLVIC